MTDAVQRLQDIEAIKQLKARYFRYVDTQNWDGFSNEVLAENVRFDIVGHIVEGRDEVVAFVAKTLRGGRSVHHGHVPEITITGPDTATGIWPMFDDVDLPRKDGSRRIIRGWGHYQEEYVRTAGGWRIRNTVLSRLREERTVV